MVVWPANLDSTKTRKQGRRLPKGAAIQSPRLEEVRDAAGKLAVETEVIPGKARPPIWWEKGGYAILPKGDSKVAILRSLATEIRKARLARAEPEKKGRP